MLPTGSLARVTRSLAEVREILDNGGLAALRRGAQEGFESLPDSYRSLASQQARLFGVMPAEAPAQGSNAFAVPVSRLAECLEAVVSVSSQLVESTAPVEAADVPSRDHDEQAATLTQLREAGRAVAAAVAQTPVAELRAGKKPLIENLAAWAENTELLYRQLKARCGEMHSITAVALEVHSEASIAYGKTMGRLAMANIGSLVFNKTVGPLISGATRLLKSGK